MIINCLIVDDEPLAIDVLRELLANFDNIKIVGTCHDAIEAFEFLKKRNIDLMFLDIQMPEISGTQFLKTLSNPPAVIFTTAFRDYAVEAFELNVVDYLLKPISLPRLMKAIEKYFQSIPLAKRELKIADEEIKEFIIVKADRKMIKVNLNEILFVEGLKDYVQIITQSKNVITRVTMQEMEDRLPTDMFLRIHRSYIVSMNKISAYTQHDIEIGKEELPIGRMYKNSVLERLAKQG